VSDLGACALCESTVGVRVVPARVLDSAEVPVAPDAPVVEMPICAACLEAMGAA
jgi:hypothetical protein